MNILTTLQLSLLLLEGVLSTSKSQNVELPEELIADVQAAITSIQKYAGTDATFPQLESLRLAPQW